MGVIYKITNLVNGKIYVGQTLCSPAKRWREHCCASRKKSRAKAYIHRAMYKHGIDSFRMEIIDHAESPEELSRKERDWIARLGTTDGAVGYNNTFGGEGCASSNPDVKRKIGAKTRQWWSKPENLRLFMDEIWDEEKRAAAAAKSREFYSSPEGKAAKETMRAKITKTHVCEACGGVFNGRQWQKHTPGKCPVTAGQKRRVKTETARAACGNAMRGTKRPPEEIARRTASVRAAWTPEKRSAFSLRMKGKKVRLGVKNSPEANANVSAASLRGWSRRRDQLTARRVA